MKDIFAALIAAALYTMGTLTGAEIVTDAVGNSLFVGITFVLLLLFDAREGKKK